MLPLMRRRSKTLPMSNWGKHASWAPRAMFSRSRKTAKVKVESGEIIKGRSVEARLSWAGENLRFATEAPGEIGAQVLVSADAHAVKHRFGHGGGFEQA